ncbi:hypothetical protein J1605_007111 [Eschrichtius robustus]|uniref:Guanylate cyclase domain-containing protein n=1 Tax=Eschrichtius robustus TaxID=9764 RepID=A0AB34H1D3_ESCRO|nr:hypothetical protein J1605_007111 [Eschrichtius robustus]
MGVRVKADIKSVALELGLEAEFQQENEGKAFQENGTARAKVRHREGEFKTCTILFSDVVTFTNICAACEPIQIVNMLNLMYSKFDRLTSVHDVYKVRVGIPTAPVLAGVMGDKMPRYCFFGDTVNTVCRMESHGLPNKVHLSPMAYRALDNQGFEIIERGEIEVKGKGKMTTYFLIRNLNASEDEIMGRPQTRLDPEEASAQGRRDSRTLAVMRSADSRRLLPKSETARGGGNEGFSQFMLTLDCPGEPSASSGALLRTDTVGSQRSAGGPGTGLQNEPL